MEPLTVGWLSVLIPFSFVVTIVLISFFVCNIARSRNQRHSRKDLESGGAPVAETSDTTRTTGTVRSAISAASATVRSVLSMPEPATNTDQASRQEGLNELGEAPPPYGAGKRATYGTRRHRGDSTRASGDDYGDRLGDKELIESANLTGGFDATSNAGVAMASRQHPVVSGSAVVSGVSIPVAFA